MSAVLLDTHAWAWSMLGQDRLSRSAVEAISSADIVLVSPVSFFEIGQKVRLGKWPAMAPFVDQLPDILDQQGAGTAPLDPRICLRAAMMDWSHRDPFDRLLAATALENSVPLISADQAFDSLADVLRIW
ncbi:type II toxin-antitoxin system VapC family toxin [Rhizobium sp. NTR19]|uniref:Type II toxin-antitoxin system VapC family toxin n=1 Tax=Neorhizobium turbinariae TaxID=2937795 RepID=A0ABT0IUR7_9HYPH|nr:type II toxin-antitoxin system VapC family toxin [Neorhizobium turbinariae]MCK8781606.1 type II toxin-antitoxin system VapC family toxin [Neorhizobium turbinariae]